MTPLLFFTWLGWSLAWILLVLLAHQGEKSDNVALETRFALDFLFTIAEPQSGDIHTALNSFYRPWVDGDKAALKRFWPDWFAYRRYRLRLQADMRRGIAA